jgi:hypothetical protein
MAQTVRLLGPVAVALAIFVRGYTHDGQLPIARACVRA